MAKIVRHPISHTCVGRKLLMKRFDGYGSKLRDSHLNFKHLYKTKITKERHVASIWIHVRK